MNIEGSKKWGDFCAKKITGGETIGRAVFSSESPLLFIDLKRLTTDEVTWCFFSVRGRFSSVSQPGINIIGKIFTKNDYKERFTKELHEGTSLLRARASLFLEEAEKNNLTILPYCGGFFVSIPTKNKNIFNDLVADHVYVIPMQDIIRVAISSLSLKDIPELVRKIKKHI